MEKLESDCNIPLSKKEDSNLPNTDFYKNVKKLLP
jgi:hypothetical protein